GNVHEDVAGSLEQIAGMHAQREDFTAARKALQEVLAIRTKLHGEEHWEVIDARLAVADVDLVAKLTPEQRRGVKEANQLKQKQDTLSQKGKYRQAIPLAREVHEVRRKLLGPEPPATATSLNNLGFLLW